MDQDYQLSVRRARKNPAGQMEGGPRSTSLLGAESRRRDARVSGQPQCRCRLPTHAERSRRPLSARRTNVHTAPAAEVLGHVAALSAAPPPATGGRGFGLPYRVSNHRIRERLGWSPAYPDYRAGLAS